jgi:hypothetical protein
MSFCVKLILACCELTIVTNGLNVILVSCDVIALVRSKEVFMRKC